MELHVKSRPENLFVEFYRKFLFFYKLIDLFSLHEKIGTILRMTCKAFVLFSYHLDISFPVLTLVLS